MIRHKKYLVSHWAHVYCIYFALLIIYNFSPSDTAPWTDPKSLKCSALRSVNWGVSILLSMLVFGLLVAITVFLHAVTSAPDGAQVEAGFVLDSRLRPQLLPGEEGLLKTDRGPMGRISAVTSARS